MSHPLRLHGKMSLELDLAILARLEYLEHCNNQQSTLLDAVLDILEKNMDAKLGISPNISTGITDERL